MNRHVYALLVGIDRYASPNIRRLSGCVNDITEIDLFLRERCDSNTYTFDPLSLLNEQATYQNIIDAFRQHLCQAGPEDVALFYYSGHGSQEPAPSEFWHLEADRLNETLVCYDSRTPDTYDLADKEMAYLIQEVARRDPHILVILDSCHSGTATREDAFTQGAIRRTSPDLRQRPLDSYKAFTLQEAKRLSDASGATEPTSNWITLPHGNHILLAACRDYETAKESSFAGRRHGIFTYTLLDTLRQSGPNLTYRDLFKRVEALLKQRMADQVPQIESSQGAELNQPFLGGAITRNPYFTLSFSDYGWVIDAGAVHGIPSVSGSETTMLAIFPTLSTPDQLRQIDNALGNASVIEVLPHLSKVDLELTNVPELDQRQIYKAIVTSMPLQQLGIFIEGDAEGTTLIETALQKTGLQQQPSNYVRQVTSLTEAALRVRAQNSTYSILYPMNDRELTPVLSGYTEQQTRKVVARLEHIARWMTIHDLTNPASQMSGLVRMEIHHITGPARVRTPDAEETEAYPDGTNLRLEYRYRKGQWRPPEYKIKLVNTSNEPVYCALAYLSEEFGIDTSSWFYNGLVRVEPGKPVWATQGKRIPSKVPDELWKSGVTEYRDVYKLIVSNEQFDATLLEQGELDSRLEPTARGGREIMRNTLSRLLHQARTRKPDLSEQSALYADWTTSIVTATIVRPLDALPVPGVDTAPLDLGSGVTVQPHSTLKARIRLTTIPQVGRDLGNQLQPPILHSASNECYLWQFSPNRGSDPGLSALELLDVQDSTMVTPEEPLLLDIVPTNSETNGSSEYILPYTYDGEFFLPLGRVTSTANGLRIELRYLPPPLKTPGLNDPELGDRSISGSIRIFFLKIIAQRFGLDDEYPLLRVAQVDENGQVHYIADAAEVKSRVAQAQRILLYVHGIIGDTLDMAASARCSALPIANRPNALHDRYDLILTFDYENLGTSMRDTARWLKNRLVALGLEKGHEKTLHIVAHSMGGLVARWFIEKEEGNSIVQHLVMLGTPNRGSPWAEIESLVVTLLGAGLNLASDAVWPLRTFTKLLHPLEHVNMTLQEMRPISPLLDELWQSADPGVPYTIIAGNTSLHTSVHDSTESNRFKRLVTHFQRLFSQETLHHLANLAFFNHPNDIAVAVSSIKHIPMERSPEPVVLEVACNHLSYFITKEGLEALATFLTEP